MTSTSQSAAQRAGQGGEPSTDPPAHSAGGAGRSQGRAEQGFGRYGRRSSADRSVTRKSTSRNRVFQVFELPADTFGDGRNGSRATCVSILSGSRTADLPSTPAFRSRLNVRGRPPRLHALSRTIDRKEPADGRYSMPGAVAPWRCRHRAQAAAHPCSERRMKRPASC